MFRGHASGRKWSEWKNVPRHSCGCPVSTSHKSQTLKTSSLYIREWKGLREFCFDISPPKPTQNNRTSSRSIIKIEWDCYVNAKQISQGSSENLVWRFICQGMLTPNDPTSVPVGTGALSLKWAMPFEERWLWTKVFLVFLRGGGRGVRCIVLSTRHKNQFMTCLSSKELLINRLPRQWYHLTERNKVASLAEKNSALSVSNGAELNLYTVTVLLNWCHFCPLVSFLGSVPTKARCFLCYTIAISAHIPQPCVLIIIRICYVATTFTSTKVLTCYPGPLTGKMQFFLVHTQQGIICLHSDFPRLWISSGLQKNNMLIAVYFFQKNMLKWILSNTWDRATSFQGPSCQRQQRLTWDAFIWMSTTQKFHLCIYEELVKCDKLTPGQKALPRCISRSNCSNSFAAGAVMYRLVFYANLLSVTLAHYLLSPNTHILSY